MKIESRSTLVHNGNNQFFQRKYLGRVQLMSLQSQQGKEVSRIFRYPLRTQNWSISSIASSLLSKFFTEFFKGYSVLLFEELTQFEEDHGCVFRLRGNDSDTGSGDITFLQQGSIRGKNFRLPENKPCTSPG